MGGIFGFLIAKEERWELYLKDIEQNCLSYFLSKQCTNTCQLTMVALSDYQEVMVVR